MRKIKSIKGLIKSIILSFNNGRRTRRNVMCRSFFTSSEKTNKSRKWQKNEKNGICILIFIFNFVKESDYIQNLSDKISKLENENEVLKDKNERLTLANRNLRLSCSLGELDVVGMTIDYSKNSNRKL